jgi:PPP family 3-phenylpropionic acid transporter
MSPTSQIPVSTPAARRFSLHLALAYSAVFGLVGINLPFFPVWLRAVGIDVGWIGLITAIPSLTRFTVLPFATSFAEGRNRLRQTIMLLTCCTLVGFVVVGQFDQPVPILVVFILTACSWTPVVPMIDGYALKGVRRYGLNYGPLRLWGSAAFVVGALACGLLVDVVAAKYLIWAIATMAMFGAIASFGLQPLDLPAASSGPAQPSTSLLRQPGFLAIIFTSALVQGSHATNYAFASIAWQSAGLGGLTISVLWSLGVIAEIIIFAISPRFTWSPATLVGFAAFGTALRWILTAQQPPVPVLAVIQTMHGISFGLTQVGIVGLLTRNVPIQRMARAQGYLAAAGGIVMSSATMLSGVLYAKYGEGAYYAMAVMALSGGGLIAFASRKWLVVSEVDG